MREQTEQQVYEWDELRVMQKMAHGVPRHIIAVEMHSSPATVARQARSAADKAGAETIVHAVAILVAQGRISVRHGGQKGSACETALAWIDEQLHSAVELKDFQQLRDAWWAMREWITEQEQTHADR